MTFSHDTTKAIEAALLAGAILEKGFYTSYSVFSKEGVHNLVTEYDYASEKALIDFFHKEFEEDAILSEEKGSLFSSSRRWIIDPLDGTANFAHRIPMFSVSIALEVENTVKTAVIYHPILKELFVAEKGKGAFLDKTRLAVTKTDKLDLSFLATGFPYNLKENPHNCIFYLTKILQRGLPIRRIGSAALDLAYLAAGRFDGFFEVTLAPWDAAAGRLLVEEAGGTVSSWDFSPYDIHSYKPILATNGLIHKELGTILQGASL